MDILSRYCLSDRPVAFQVLSDQAVNFTSGYAQQPAAPHQPESKCNRAVLVGDLGLVSRLQLI